MGVPGSGRRRKSTRGKLAEGDPGGRLGDKVPLDKPESEAAPPDWLTEGALAEWQRLSPDLIRLGLLTGCDQAEFANYCSAVDDVKRAQLELKTWWTEDKLANCDKKPPIFQVITDLRRQIHTLAEVLGLTPTSRERMAIAPKKAEGGLDSYVASKPKPNGETK